MSDTLNEIKVTLKKSLIGTNKMQKEAVRCLGLRKINQSKVFKDSPAFRGQINVVSHLVVVEESQVDGSKKAVKKEAKTKKVTKKVTKKTATNKNLKGKK